MNDKGMGVLLHMLFGDDETGPTLQAVTGKRITGLLLSDELREDGALRFTFEDGTQMDLYDDGRSCCESRYMHTDDNVSDFIGATLQSIEVRDAPNVPDEYGEHEVQFLYVNTDRGTFTLETHNEHNGYYGGFWLKCQRVEAA